MNDVLNTFVDTFDVNDPVSIAMIVVSGLILIVSIISIFVAIMLAIRYVKYNKAMNKAGLSGETAARKILDNNGLQHIKVKTSGSLMFGNSYSHYFKKVRLRRRTMRKPSVASLAMAAQKSSLAVLDKEHDPDMKRRVVLTPILTFGPLAFIPLVIIGVGIDIALTQKLGTYSVICAGIGFLFYLYSFIMSLTVLKTERKAQDKAIVILRESRMATEEELAMMKKLFHLYNIEYVNNMVMSMLEMIYYVLRIIMIAKGNSSSRSKD